MKKYFIMSDIHSFFDAMQTALNSAGFELSNDNHILIICGDIFDRGNQSLELYNWLMQVPEDRLILVQGNHELLYFELLKKDFPDDYDYSNGTVHTFCNLAEVAYDELDANELIWNMQAEGRNVTSAEIKLKLKNNWRKVKHKVENHPATKWLKSEKWVNFYELDSFIFVHSFIPLHVKPAYYNVGLKYYPTYDFPSDLLEPVPEWRTKASTAQWDDAKWGCPWRQFNAGLFNDEIKDRKRLVCGHWHTSDFHRKFEGDMSNNLNVFYSDSLIALDACTAASQFCNILVIDYEDNKCYDQNKKYLGDI